jgi:PAS domain S-box-containing protein
MADDNSGPATTREDHLRAILESSTDGYWEYNLATGMVYVGNRLFERLGYAPADLDLNFDHWMTFVHPADVAPTLAAYAAHVNGQLAHYQIEHRLRAHDGTWRWMLNRGQLIERDDRGEPLIVVGTYTDISERKQAEAALQQRNRELAFLNGILQGLTSTLDLDQVLTQVLEELRGMLDVTASSVWLIDGYTQELVCHQATGPYSSVVRQRRVPIGTGLVGWVAQFDQSLIVADAQSDPRHFSEVDRATGLMVRSVISVPIRAQQRLIGVIQAVDEAPWRFDADALHLVELLASAAVIAIENARLFGETQQRADRLAVLTEISTAINQPLDLNAVVQAAVSSLTRTLHISQTGLALFDETRQHLVIMADVPASGSLPVSGVKIPVAGNASMEQILTTRLPLAIYDAQHDPLVASIHDLMWQRQVQSMLLVPLLVRGEVIGTFGCDTVDRPRRFTQEDVDLTITVANLIAVRIDQARLFEAERDQRRLAEALRESAAVLNRTLYFDEVLDRVLENADRVVPHDAADIMLIDATGVARVARDRGYAERGLHSVIDRVRLVVAEAPTLRFILETGQPLVIPNTLRDTRWIMFPELEWVRSYAGAPIQTKEGVIGFLQIASRVPDFFTPVHAERLQAFADQAAIAIANARLYDQVQHYADELEQRVAERTRDLNNAYERLQALDRMKDQFVSSISHELRTPIANIQLYLNLLDKGKPEKRAIYVETLHRETARLNKMIEDLLDISHLDMGKTELRFAAVDVNRVVTSSLAERKPDALERNLRLEAALLPELAKAHADATLIAQAVSNLLSNAINFTPPGGSVLCSTAYRSYADREWITITVKDSGPGIAADEQQHLGERFYRGRVARNYKVPGTGLGLAMCKEILDRHGGRLTIESEVGQGAAFTIWLKPA